MVSEAMLHTSVWSKTVDSYSVELSHAFLFYFKIYLTVTKKSKYIFLLTNFTFFI